MENTKDPTGENGTTAADPKGDRSPPAERNRSRYILLNTLSSYGRDAVDTVAFLVLIPFIIKMLGKESFGLWSLIWSFLAIFELADLGSSAAVVKFVADARSRQDMDQLKRIICTLFWAYVIQGTVVMAAIGASLLFFNRVFDIPQDQASYAHAVLLILGIRSALYLPLGMFRGVLVGFQKMAIANGYKVVATLIYLVAVILLLTFTPDIRVLATANMVTGLLPMLAMMIHCRFLTPAFTLHPRYFERSLVGRLSSFSLYFSLIQVAGMIATRSDAMVIKLFLSLETVGIYSIGMRLSEKASLFCSHLTRALTPVFAELHGAGEKSNIRAAHYLGTKLTVAFATPLLVGLALLAEPLVVAWTGPDFLGAVPVCQWLAAAAMVGLVHGNSVNVLSMGGHHRYVALCILGGQVLNLILSLILIHPLGIVGVSMATFIAAVPTYAGFIERFAGRLQGRSVWHFYRATVLPSVIPALVMAGMFFVIRRSWTLTHLLDVAILETLGIATFGAVYWVVGFQAKERAYFADKVVRVLRRRTAGSTTR
jgi:O-antigen/teichoic acid export membrane protein